MLDRQHLTRFAWLSIGTAVIIIALKAAAYFLTGSIGLLSDALESGVNLVTAVLTGGQPLDPILAILVALQLLRFGCT